MRSSKDDTVTEPNRPSLTCQLFARKVIRIFGDITKDDIENDTRAISTLCDGKCRYIVEVLQHGWLVDMSLYFINMEYCQATLDLALKMLTRPNMGVTSMC
jgi:hypothetical protein